MKKIEHLGIAVRNLEESCALFSQLFDVEVYKTEVIASEKVRTAFLRIGNNKIELLESLDDTGVIAKYIRKKGEGIHHVAFEVSDITKEIERLEKKGFRMINNTPKRGADNKMVCFIHPKSSNGVLIELCQEIKVLNKD